MDRTGISPAARPTEWTTAVVLLVTAFVAWQNDRDTAALVAVAAAALPAIVTAAASWWDRRHGSYVVALPPPAEVYPPDDPAPGDVHGGGE